ncbi:MAG: hypothetical protein IK141_07070 [Clostridia bacterium]|nr:hypothetical protein [Clostridia bacterium]
MKVDFFLFGPICATMSGIMSSFISIAESFLLKGWVSILCWICNALAILVGTIFLCFAGFRQNIKRLKRLIIGICCVFSATRIALFLENTWFLTHKYNLRDSEVESLMKGNLFSAGGLIPFLAAMLLIVLCVVFMLRCEKNDP